MDAHYLPHKSKDFLNYLTFFNMKIIFRKGLLAASLIIVLSLPLYTTVNLEEIVAGPYVQNVGDNCATVMWKTGIKTERNVVYWGTSYKLGNKTVVNESEEWHEVRLDGLKPLTKYFYKVESDGIESPIYSFTTFGNSEEGSENFTFIVYGDSRGVWDNWGNTRIVAEAIEKEKPCFVINTGDMVKNGVKEEEWISFFQASPFMHNSSLYPAVGNHDLPTSSFCKYFSLPNNEIYYSFDYGNAHFTILNSNTPFSPSQFIWMLKDLQIKKTWKIVIFHHPPYSSGHHGNNTLLRLWIPFFKIANVDIVFNGHDHDYEHIKVGGIHYIVTGGGGAPLYKVEESKWTILSASSYHYCKISINSSSLHFEALKPDGTLIESFDIKH